MVLCLVSVFLVSGCAWFRHSEPEKLAPELIADGMDAYDSGNYHQAIKSFEKLKDWYPFSKYAILAELKIADANYHLQEYADAVSAYEDFENLHPRNEAIPYVIFQIGQCYFEQMDTMDRDQTMARKALKVFQQLVKQFPNTTYGAQGMERIKNCQKSLSGHEFDIGLFYYEHKHYEAALARFRSILETYPDVGIHQKVLRYIGLCEAAQLREAKK
jgi:outer membrane protein assembly factor BamD